MNEQADKRRSKLMRPALQTYQNRVIQCILHNVCSNVQGTTPSLPPADSVLTLHSN